MKTSIPGRVRTYKAIMWDLSLSAVGCFVSRNYFRLVAEGGTQTKVPIVAMGQSRDPLTYVGAALIPLALLQPNSGFDSRAVTETHPLKRHRDQGGPIDPSLGPASIAIGRSTN
jgi:hypothetical protein